MRAGRLKVHGIAIQVPDTVDDGGGGGRKPNPAGDGSGWRTVAIRSASVVDISASKRVETGALLAGITTRVTMRSGAPVTSSSRLKIGTRYLYVVGPPIDPDGRGRELQLTCEERAA